MDEEARQRHATAMLKLLIATFVVILVGDVVLMHVISDLRYLPVALWLYFLIALLVFLSLYRPTPLPNNGNHKLEFPTKPAIYFVVTMAISLLGLPNTERISYEKVAKYVSATVMAQICLVFFTVYLLLYLRPKHTKPLPGNPAA